MPPTAGQPEAVSSLLTGRTTFEMLQGYWPEDWNDVPHDDDIRAISRLNNVIDEVPSLTR